jgi:hypothetical protein
MATDWILRAGDGENFLNSSDYRIWGIKSTSNCGKHFVKNVKQGDRLWFVKNKSQGKIIAVGTYKSHNERVLGPLVNTTMTDEELGWSKTGCDIEVHYTHLYLLSNCNLLTYLKAQTEIVKYKREKYEIDLPTEYENILRSWDDCF